MHYGATDEIGWKAAVNPVRSMTCTPPCFTAWDSITKGSTISTTVGGFRLTDVEGEVIGNPGLTPRQRGSLEASAISRGRVGPGPPTPTAARKMPPASGLQVATRSIEVSTRRGDPEGVPVTKAARRHGLDRNPDLGEATSGAGIMTGHRPAAPQGDPKMAHCIGAHAVRKSVGHSDDRAASRNGAGVRIKSNASTRRVGESMVKASVRRATRRAIGNADPRERQGGVPGWIHAVQCALSGLLPDRQGARPEATRVVALGVIEAVAGRFPGGSGERREGSGVQIHSNEGIVLSQQEIAALRGYRESHPPGEFQ